MKTLREYIDILDEISRRDFLKGAGAATLGTVLSSISMPQAFAKYNLSQDDWEVFSAAASMIYFAAIGKGNRGDAAMARSIINDLAEVQGVPRAYNDAFIFDTFEGMAEKNFQKYKILEEFNQPRHESLRVRYLNKFLRILDRVIENLPPDQYRLHADKLGHTIRSVPMPRQESQSLEESEPKDSISKIDRLFRDA
jgi:hypothetical protein